MNRKISLGAAITVIVLAVALTISATMALSMRHFSSLVSDVGQRQAMYDYLDEIDTAARRQYTIDEELLRVALAKGYLEGLNDQYAEYLTSAEYKAVQSELAGTRTGFGLQIVVPDGSNELTVSYVAENSPAALAGIHAGDVITAVNEYAVTGAAYAAVQGHLSGTEKLLMKLTQNGTAVDVELIPTNTYTYVSVQGRLIGESVGYMRIRSFNSLTALQFKSLYNELTRQGAQYFVFDLRNNEGGSLAAAQEILGYLLPSGPYVKCTKKAGTEAFTASDPYEMTAAAAVLVNGNTTGEAELFAAVLQDLSKARLVGTSTAGKAVVQEYFSLASDKAAVKLTTGTLTLIQSETSWQDTGLIPDKTVDLPYSKLLKFEMLSEAEDDQLQAAIELLKPAVPENDQQTGEGETTTTTTTAVAE